MFLYFSFVEKTNHDVDDVLMLEHIIELSVNCSIVNFKIVVFFLINFTEDDSDCFIGRNEVERFNFNLILI